MFYLTHLDEEEERGFLYAQFGLSLAENTLSPLRGDQLLKLRGDQAARLAGDAIIWLDSETASWAVLEHEEPAVAAGVRGGVSYAALVLRMGREREAALHRLLGHLWRAGLLEVNGEGRWPRDLLGRGPLFRPSYLVEIHLTSRCNLACRYCFAGSGPGGSDLPDDLARRAVELAMALPTQDLTIEFAGGEPLLRLPLLRELVAQIHRESRSRASQVRTCVQTNGLLFRGEVLEFFVRHPDVEVGISLDGPSRVNDLARVGADGRSRHGEIEAAVRAAVSLRGKEAGALAVIHAGSWSRPREIAAYFASLGLGKLRLNPMVPFGRGRADGADLAVSPRQYLLFMSGVLDYLGETRAFEESNLEALVRNLVLKVREYRCMRSPCGAGYDYFVVDAAGDLYACARFVGRADLRLGNVADPHGLEDRFLNSPLVRGMADRVVSRVADCRVCPWRHFCEGGCALHAHAESGRLEAPDPWCEYYRGIYPYLIQHLYRRPEMVGHFFPRAVPYRVSASPTGAEAPGHAPSESCRATDSG